MNHSFIQLFDVYKTAVILNKTKVFFNHSKQSLLFAEFLLQQAFISGIYTQITHRKKVLILHIKYNRKKLPATSDFSVSSKVAFQRPIKKMSGGGNQNNFIVNLKSKKGNYGRLLARVR